jgi:hypothetical protein
MDNAPYDTSLVEVSYANDTEYRAVFRRVFGMKPVPRDADMDALTADEIDYDVEAASRAMDNVYERTASDPLFQELYDLAAAKMFSLDRTIGMAILFAFDNFAHYHQCLRLFFLEPASWTRSHPTFVAMLNKIE